MIYNKVLDYKKDQEANEFSCYISDIPIEYLNSIRRTIMTDYSKYAFNNVEFKINNSLLNDEILRNRIEMIPIRCEMELDFSIKIKNNKQKFLDVYSKSIVCNISGMDFYINPNILITTLKKGESLEVSMTSHKESADTHVKYRSTNVIILKKMKVVKYIGPLIMKKQVMDILIDRYNMKLDQNRDDTGILDTARTNLNLPRILKELLSTSEELITLEYLSSSEKDVYFFSIETDYYNPELIFQESVELLINRIKNIKYNVSRVCENKKYYIELINESPTVANLLQLELNQMKEVNFSYFYKPYPISKDVELQIFFHKEECNSFESFLKEAQDKVCLFLQSNCK